MPCQSAGIAAVSVVMGRTTAAMSVPMPHSTVDAEPLRDRDQMVGALWRRPSMLHARTTDATMYAVKCENAEDGADVVLWRRSFVLADIPRQRFDRCMPYTEVLNRHEESRDIVPADAALMGLFL